MVQMMQITKLNTEYDYAVHTQMCLVLEGWRAAITVGTNDGPLTELSNR